MSEQYFFMRKLGLGKEVVSLSLVVTEVCRAGEMRYFGDDLDRDLNTGTFSGNFTVAVKGKFNKFCGVRCFGGGLWCLSASSSESGALELDFV